MKKSFLLFAIAILAFGTASYAQKTVKLAHLNSAELMQVMPGRDSAQTAFQNKVSELEAVLTAMQEEYQTKLNDYQERQSQMTDLIRKTKEQDLMDLRQRIETYKEGAEQQLMTTQQELLQPIIDRFKKAVADVAKENGYTYVFDTSAGALLYQQDSDDISALVKKKLGI